MDLQTLLQWSEFAGNLAVAASSLGVIAGLVYVAQAYWERHRWQTFASLVEGWAESDFRAGHDLPEHQWRFFAANWLSEAEFSPSQSIKLLDFAVLHAKARTDFVLKDFEQKE